MSKDYKYWDNRYCQLMDLRSVIENECSEELYVQKQEQFITDIVGIQILTKKEGEI